MKALPASSLESYESVRLYRDDIEAIIALLSEAGLKVKISDDRHEYESLDELARVTGKSPRSLTISGDSDKDYGSVSISKRKNYWVVTRGGSARTVGHEVESILR